MTDPAATIVGARIRQRREELRLSQETAAKLAKMNVANFGKIERGIGNPTLTSLVRIAVVLGTDPSELIAGIGAESLSEFPRAYSAEEFLAAKAAAARG